MPGAAGPWALREAANEMEIALTITSDQVAGMPDAERAEEEQGERELDRPGDRRDPAAARRTWAHHLARYLPLHHSIDPRRVRERRRRRTPAATRGPGAAGDAQVGQQQGHRFGGNRGAAVGVDRAGCDTEAGDGIGDELLGQLTGLGESTCQPTT